jgi:peptide/nickel transport system substrate-binding protein
MRRFALALAALSSWLLLGVCDAGTRPHYGGTLHVSMRAALSSLDPADESTPDPQALSNVSRLLFDTLVRLDNKGTPQPSLADSWQAEAGNQRWTFHLRSDVRLQNGRPLTDDIVAASIRMANAKWKVSGTGDTVVVECDTPHPDLPSELALSRNAIVVRDGKRLVGTGPFAIADWQPGKKLTLSAREDYWNGRAFLDSVEIDIGRNLREQMIALDLGKAELIEVAPEQAHRATVEGRRIASSAPTQLLALVFREEHPTDDEIKLRQALSLSTDRVSLNNVILQGGGEPAGGLLPNWMSGYSFLFSTTPDVKRARDLRNEVRQATTWTVGYDRNDPMARLLAERIALNAHDAGLSLQPTVAANADMQLTWIPMASVNAGIALKGLARPLGVTLPPSQAKDVDELYRLESTLLASQGVIPLLHVRVNYGLAPTLKNWHQEPDGSWDLSDVWLGAAKP